MKFIIQGEPIAQQRHRTFRRGCKSINYDPLTKEKQLFREELYRQVGHPFNLSYSPEERKEVLYLPYKDFYHVSLMFVFPVPKSSTKAQKKAKLAGLVHTQVPDLDNLEKFVLDILSGVLFSDDKKVVKLESWKIWGENARTEIEIVGFNHEVTDG